MQRDELFVDDDGVVLKRRAIDVRGFRSTPEVSDVHPEVEHRSLAPIADAVDELNEAKEEDVVAQHVADVDASAAIFGQNVQLKNILMNVVGLKDEKCI